MAICFYLLLKAVIDYVAQSASTRIENPFGSIAKDSPVAPQKWIDYFGFGGGKELGSLEDAFRGSGGGAVYSAGTWKAFLRS